MKTPATPLPWETSSNARGDWDVCAADAGDMIADVVSGRHNRDPNPNIESHEAQDSAYIAHAANAYPQLVAALRDACARHADMKNRLGGEVAASFERADDARRALLLDLGEVSVDRINVESNRRSGKGRA